jgi:hypothetical protein
VVNAHYYYLTANSGDQVPGEPLPQLGVDLPDFVGKFSDLFAFPGMSACTTFACALIALTEQLNRTLKTLASRPPMEILAERILSTACRL